VHPRLASVLALSLPLAPALSSGCGGKAEQGPATEPAASAITLEVTEPDAGSHVPAGALVIEGEQAGLAEVWVGGEAVDASSGRFEHEVQVARGIYAVDVEGLNAAGTARRLDRRSVLAGTFGEASGAVDEALGLRVNRGGLSAAAGYAVTFLDPVTLTDAVAAANPVYDSWIATVNVGDVAFGDPSLQLVPTPGALQVSLVLPDVALWLPSDIALLGYEDVWVTCAEARVSGALTLGTDGDGHLDVGLADATVDLVDFEYDTSILDGDALALFDGTIEGVLEDELLLQMNTLLPELLATQLGSLELAFAFDLLGAQASVASAFRSARVDADGVMLVADLEVDLAGNGTKSAPGYLVADDAQPTPDTDADISMALSDDLVNRLLYEAWTAGMLDQRLSSDDGTLDPTLLAAFEPGDEASLALDARLPPVLVQRDGEAELQVGELLLRLDTPGGGMFDYLEVALSAALPVDLEVTDGELTVALGKPDVSFVVRDTDWRATDEQVTALLEDELPIETLVLLLGRFSFPLPELAGFQLEQATIERDPTEVFTNVAVAL
jgi:hypothetical protein